MTALIFKDLCCFGNIGIGNDCNMNFMMITYSVEMNEQRMSMSSYISHIYVTTITKNENIQMAHSSTIIDNFNLLNLEFIKIEELILV